MSKRLRGWMAVLCLLTAGTATAAEPAPAFELPTLDGQVSLASLKGRVVYVDFWATWCPPCRRSFPWMKKMQARYRDDGLTIVAISMDQSRKAVLEFLDTMQPNFTIAFDPKGEVAQRYRVQAMPSSFLIDREGHLRYRHLGFRSRDTEAMERRIQSLLTD